MPGLLSYDYGDVASGDIEVRKDGSLVPLGMKLISIDWNNDFYGSTTLQQRVITNAEIIRQITSCFDQRGRDRKGIKMPILKRIPVLQVYIRSNTAFTVKDFYYPSYSTPDTFEFATFRNLTKIMIRWDTNNFINGKKKILYVRYHDLSNSETSSVSLEAEE